MGSFKDMLNEESPENLLRQAGYKIKMVTPTSFGTQIDLYVVPDDIDDVLSDYEVKTKGKTIFVVNENARSLHASLVECADALECGEDYMTIIRRLQDCINKDI